MNLFKYFKLKKKQKLEQQLKGIILFNKWKIQCYKEYPKDINPPLKKFINSSGIARLFMQDQLEYFKRYHIDKKLFDKQSQYHDVAMDEYYKLEKRLKQKKLDEEERKQINLYKKAILELRKEEKI